MEALKNNATFRAATAALGEGFDRLREVEGVRLWQRLIKLAPLRRFVAENQEPLRRIASNTRQMRWMLPYIEFIVRLNGQKASAAPSGHLRTDDRSGVQLDAHAADIDLAFDPDDPECVAQVPVYVFGQGGAIENSWMATSIRVRARIKANDTFNGVMAYITKIEKLRADGEWQDSDAPDTQTTWTDNGSFSTNLSGKVPKYVNVLHIDHPDNKIKIWGVWGKPMLPPPLVDFFRDATTYRFTVQVMAERVEGHTRIEVHWPGQWERLQVFSVS